MALGKLEIHLEFKVWKANKTNENCPQVSEAIIWLLANEMDYLLVVDVLTFCEKL